MRRFSKDPLETALPDLNNGYGSNYVTLPVPLYEAMARAYYGQGDKGRELQREDDPRDVPAGGGEGFVVKDVPAGTVRLPSVRVEPLGAWREALAQRAAYQEAIRNAAPVLPKKKEEGE